MLGNLLGWEEWGLERVDLALLWARRSVLQRLQNPGALFFDMLEELPVRYSLAARPLEAQIPLWDRPELVSMRRNGACERPSWMFGT